MTKAKKSSAVILGLAEGKNRESQKENDCHSEAKPKNLIRRRATLGAIK